MTTVTGQYACPHSVLTCDWPLTSFSRTCNGRSQEVRWMKAWVLRSSCQVHHSCARKCHSKYMSENPARVSSTTLDPQTNSVMLFAKQGQSSYSLNARTWQKTTKMYFSFKWDSYDYKLIRETVSLENEISVRWLYPIFHLNCWKYVFGLTILEQPWAKHLLCNLSVLI